MKNILNSLVPLDKDNLAKNLNSDDLRKSVFKFVNKIAPEYECPEGLGCHIITPNKNCIYYKNIEEEHFPDSNILVYEDVQKYENFYGFCPYLLDFIFFVFDNLLKNKSFSKENHNCDSWIYSPPLSGDYYKREDREDGTISEKHYLKCIICGKEKIRVDLEK
jgi:hypothetical protein